MEQEKFVFPTKEQYAKIVPRNSMPHTLYRFICQRQVNFGEAVYVVGNTEQLGQWNINCALRLECYYSNYWIIDVEIPIDTEIQYKFFVSSYEHHFSQKGLEIPSQNWIGNEQGINFKLFVSKREAAKMQENRKTKALKIMSFNIRCQTKDDPDQFHWNHRKQNCIEVIKENYPSILGIQEPRRSQKPYMCSQLNHLYNYVGVTRDCTNNGEEVGIFYDKQRFLPVQHGYRWISESRQPGSIGFGASYPRYFTYMILEDTFTSEKFHKVLTKQQQEIATWIPRNLIMVINVHLDHESGLARQRGVEYIAEQIQFKKSSYQDELKDFFVFGDFNTYENPHVFHRFYEISPSLESTRTYFERKNLNDLCDYEYTFNGFRKLEEDVKNKWLVIDHLFIHNEMYKPAEFKVIRRMVHQPCNPKYNIVSDHYPIMGVFKPIVTEK